MIQQRQVSEPISLPGAKERSLVLLMVNNLSANARDVCSIPELGRSPRVGNGNPLQYSCLENSIGREAWRAPAYGAAEPDTRSAHTPPTHTKREGAMEVWVLFGSLLLIYVAASGPSCGMQDLHCIMRGLPSWCPDPLVVACGLSN